MIPTRALILFTIVFAFSLPLAGEAQTRVRRNVEIEWEAVEAASLYEVQVIRKDDEKKKPLRFKVKTPKWSATIKPGLYDMQIRSYDDRGVPGSWSPPSELQVRLPAVIALNPQSNAVVKSKDGKSTEVEFKWEPVPGAAKYVFKAQTADGKWNKETESDTPSATIDVPVGEFVNWEAVAIDEKGDDGDKWDAPQTFELRGPALEKPAIEKPLSSYIKEVKWAPPEFAAKYDLELKFHNPKTKKWESIEKKDDHPEPLLKLDTSRPTGRYRLQVQAKADRREVSKPAQLDFEMQGGFKSSEDVENAIVRQSITKPYDFYAIASYLLTQISYKSKNYDENSGSSFKDAVGGTGRIGLGYQDEHSKWGGFGIVDLSGFVIGGQNFKFASLEGHLTRKLEFGQGGLLLFGTGLFSKELPIVLGSQSENLRGVGKTRGIGPHAGFTYWVPLSARFGIQANARAYYTLMGSASSGGKALPALSMQLGALGSYRLAKAWMGYAGYAYRADEARFESQSGSTTSFASPGDINEVSVQGHYLNMILEFSF